jgi:Tfp pilus assembly protein PilP
MNISFIMRNSAVLALCALGLTACGGDMDDLDEYINEVKARPGGRIEPLPEITPYQVFMYVADDEGLSISKAFRWTRYVWLARCILATRCTDLCKQLTG